MGVSLRTAAGSDTLLAGDVIEQLRAGLRGTLLTPGAPGYDEARTVWNAMVDRRPGIIVRCAGAADVIRAVRFAGEHGVALSVRGGGHNVAGSAVADGGLMIDLSPMKSVRVDPAARTARVEPGATLGDVDGETQAFGLAAPFGINSTTGVAGLTLGGGFGWLSRSLGLSIDSLLAVDVVTADGRLLHASEDEHADLFWAVRGGGGNFGVVTSFEFRLHAVGPQVLAGLIVHPLDAARSVMRFYRDFIARSPEQLVVWCVMRKAPPAPFIPAEWHGREVLVLACCWSGELAAGEWALQPLRGFGKPLADVVGPQPFTAWQQALDPLLGPGARNYWKSNDHREATDGLIDAMITFARKLPDDQTDIGLLQLGGAVSRVPSEATAYTHRDAQFVLNIHGRWSDPAKDAACIGWVRDLFHTTEPFATGGVYVNFMTQEEGDRVPAAYGENYDRLVSVKNRYDPKNLFRANQNIRPTG